ASFGYRNFWFVDGTFRVDQSSTLPEDENTYYYPSISSSLVFSSLVDLDWLSFGKLRANWAEVGNSPPALSVFDVYASPTNFTSPLYSVPSTANNPDLKAETTRSWEAGLEVELFDRRAGFDLAFYQTNSVDQLMAVSVSAATGYSSKWVNAG